jgi:hypothetical protein
VLFCSGYEFENPGVGYEYSFWEYKHSVLVMYGNQQGGYNKIMMQMQNLKYTLDNTSLRTRSARQLKSQES